mmetsp:Transcript_18930/g.60816  ORF Transcript_18930/g.60816 Transcript_18930/m.60816 type:complete len:84 (-) Transcript_18930:92-343(-)
MVCGPICSSFCSGVSAFGVIIMFTLGHLISSDYKYVGEWHNPDGPSFEDQKALAVKNCYLVAFIYACFMAVSLVAVCWHARKR